MTQESSYVGIDVSKAALDVAVRPQNETWTVSNDEASINALAADLKARKLTLIVLESTGGGLELPLVAAWATAQLPYLLS